jgi:hypothetical protein
MVALVVAVAIIIMHQLVLVAQLSAPCVLLQPASPCRCTSSRSRCLCWRVSCYAHQLGVGVHDVDKLVYPTAAPDIPTYLDECNWLEVIDILQATHQKPEYRWSKP